MKNFFFCAVVVFYINNSKSKFSDESISDWYQRPYVELCQKSGKFAWFYIKFHTELNSKYKFLEIWDI